MIRKKKTDFNSEDWNKLSISDLKRMADYWLRQFLVNKAGSEYLTCPLTFKRCHISDMDVAHYIDRGVMNTRYDLGNCHLVSRQSNVWDAQVQIDGYKSKHHRDYENFLGEEKVKKLKEKSEVLAPLTKDDYICLIEKFKRV